MAACMVEDVLEEGVGGFEVKAGGVDGGVDRVGWEVGRVD